MILLTFLACSDRVVDLDDDSTGITLFRGENDDLATPYVLGGSVEFQLSADRFWGDPESWELRADSERIELASGELQQDGDVFYEATFLAAGTTDLEVWEGDRLLDSVAIEILAADTVEFTARGEDIMDIERSAIDGLTVVAGGDSAWNFDYLADGVLLYGRDALELGGAEDAGFEVEIRDFALASSQDTLVLRAPAEPGEHSFGLIVGGSELRSIEVSVVSVDEIAALELVLDDEEEADEGDRLHVLVRGFTDDGTEVHGLPGEWSLGVQADSDETGDLFAYDFDEDIEQQLVVRLGDGQATATIHGIGSVGTTTTCGPAGVPASLLLGLTALLGIRRRQDG